MEVEVEVEERGTLSEERRKRKVMVEGVELEERGTLQEEKRKREMSRI